MSKPKRKRRLTKTELEAVSLSYEIIDCKRAERVVREAHRLAKSRKAFYIV